MGRNRLLVALAAVIAGNALYFALLVPRLPAWLQHGPFVIDAGLLLDFVLCVALYLLFGRLFQGRRRSR